METVNKTKIKTITGHLTAIEKTHIKELFRLKMTAGKINRKTYHIKKVGKNFEVSITENLREGFELTAKPRTYKSTFVTI